MRKIPCISFIAIYILLFVVSANAQLKTPPVIEWQRSLGGSYWDEAFDIQQTTDGGYIVAGNSASNDWIVKGHHGEVGSSDDCWIVKLTNKGKIDWQKCFGGNEDDEAYSIQQTMDGGYIFAGCSNSIGGDVTGLHGYYDVWIVKLTNVGEIEWQKSLGGSDDDKALSVQQTTDDGYIIAGYSKSIDGDVTGHHGSTKTSDFWIVKLTAVGDIEWERSLGGSYWDQALDIQQTTDGGYIVAGASHSSDGDVTSHHGSTDSNDCWIVKLTSTGSIEWEKSLGGDGGEFAECIQQTVDGGFVVTGRSRSVDGDVTGNKGSLDYWVVKLTSLGVIEWSKSLGGSASDGAYSIKQTKDDGYVLAGSTMSSDGDVTGLHGAYDVWIVKLSNIGDIKWQKSIGGSIGDAATSIEQTTDGGYIVAGFSFSYNGDVTDNYGYSDYWIVKLSPEGTSSVETESATAQVATISPNPATSSTTLSLESDEEGICEVQIISVTGVTLKQYSTRLVTGKQEIVLTDLESLPSGMYEVLVKRNGYVAQQTKLIIE